MGWGLALVALATLGLGVVVRLRGLMLEDDAFIFVRYADHILQQHRIAWNPGGPPSYGTTSLLYLLVVTALRALAGPAPARVAVLGSLLPGLLFLAALGHLAWRQGLRGSRARGTLALVLLVPLALSIETLGAHFATGMDTTLALLYVTLLLRLATRFEAAPTHGRALALGLAGGAAWAVRPDLLVLAGPIVVAGLASPAMRTRRSVAIRLAGAMILLLGLEWALCWAVLGTPVPLSFYVKSAVRYGAGMDAAYAGVPGRELGQFLQAYAPFLLLVLLAIGSEARHRRWLFTPAETGALLGGLAFVAYYRFFVLQVMPHYHRFYFPSLPIWIALACRAAVVLEREAAGLPRSKTAGFQRAALGAGIALAVTSAVILVRPWPVWFARARARPWFTEVPAALNLDGWSRRWWFRLEEMSALPSDIV